MCSSDLARLMSGGREKFVGLDGDNFIFVERPIFQGTAASKLPRDSGAFNDAALNWVDQIATNLQRGYVIAIDYGRLGEEVQRDVQVRAQHRRLSSPFEQIGEADITMPVDWTSIVHRAETNGLRVAGFTDQHHFLTGIISELGKGGSPEPPADDWSQSFLPDSPKTKRELQTLLHPEMLGRAFQVLALEKNVAEPANHESPQLAGFKFPRELRSGLRVNDSI